VTNCEDLPKFLRSLIMPVDLAALVAPEHTALLTVEVQQDVVGADSILPDLAAASGSMVPNIAALARAARPRARRALHGRAPARPTRARATTPASSWPRASGASRAAGPPAPAVLHPDLGVEPSDLVMPRLQGLSPLYDSGVDAALRHMGVTIVATGVSVNVALLATVIEGVVNRAHQVVVPRDAWPASAPSTSRPSSTTRSPSSPPSRRPRTLVDLSVGRPWARRSLRSGRGAEPEYLRGRSLTYSTAPESLSAVMRAGS
jgi:nicotinamidase-related amidase